MASVPTPKFNSLSSFWTWAVICGRTAGVAHVNPGSQGTHFGNLQFSGSPNVCDDSEENGTSFRISTLAWSLQA